MEGFHYQKKDTCLEKVTQNSGSLALLAKAENLEVMELIIHSGKEFILIPSENDQLVEFFYILNGTIHDETHSLLYQKGDLFYINRLKEPIYLVAKSTTKLLYILNESLFFMLSDKMKKLISTITKVEEKDTYTEKHSNRVMEYAVMLAKSLDTPSIDMTALTYSALFHDLGKIDIPTEILQKPGRLSQEEMELIRKHPALGKALADEIHLANMGDIIEQHHERIDGSGYPKGLKDEEIRIEAKIIGIVDSFDAMTSDRAYRRGLSRDEALHELEIHKGSWYDSQLVDLFAQIIRSKSIGA
ncbi:MAG: HD domain-containing protein [Vallitaleaceae bacterium]|nr:HD domain-containing protein [Vallitaleaceae bacterium]